MVRDLSAFGNNLMMPTGFSMTYGITEAAAGSSSNSPLDVIELQCNCNEPASSVACVPDYIFGCRGLASVAASDRIALGGTLSSAIGMLTDLKYL